jgi:haloalkane dehalogenase
MVPTGSPHPSIGLLEESEHWARGFKGPVALVWGMRDPILGRSLKRMREVFPGAPVTETAAGHFLQEEVPEVLAEAILQVTLGRITKV